MSTNANAMIKAGVDAYRAGDKAKARQLLEKAVDLDQQNEMAWLWLSAVVESKEEQQLCLENVLVINPANERAKQGLKSLGVDPDTVINQPAAAETYDAYAVPSSSASVNNAISETSSEEYDDWVDNLGIGGSGKSAPTQTDDIFSDVDFSSDAGFDFGEELFEDNASYDAYDDGDEYADEAYEDDEYASSGGSDYYGDEVSDIDDLYADMNTLEEFDSMLDEDIHDYDMDEFSGDPFQEPEPEPAEPEPPSLDDLFAQIPKEIAPTRLPGSIEPRPTSALIPVIIMGILNVLAVLFIIFQFLS